VLRVEVSEEGRPALPPIDLDGDFAIGSGAAARVRLPAVAACDRHVEVANGAWRALAEVKVDGVSRTSGAIGDGITLELGSYRVRIGRAPAGAVASPSQRTESLARELVRSWLGVAPTLVIERGPRAGAERALAPPESQLVIGRGDDAGWVIVDSDLSKRHAEVRRGWDGIRVIDLGSKNGTRLDGRPVREAMLHDGARLELGGLVLRFRDPAERHLGAPPHVAIAARRAAGWPFYVALTIAGLALVGLGWLASW
jgi:hypothetical protein